jgi:hypothetical protein
LYGDRAGIGFERVKRAAIEKTRELRVEIHRAQSRRYQAFRGGLDEYDARARVLEDIGDAVGRELDVDRHRHDARAHRAEYRHDELDAVQREYADALARLQPGPGEPRARPHCRRHRARGRTSDAALPDRAGR